MRRTFCLYHLVLCIFPHIFLSGGLNFNCIDMHVESYFKSHEYRKCACLCILCAIFMRRSQLVRLWTVRVCEPCVCRWKTSTTTNHADVGVIHIFTNVTWANTITRMHPNFSFESSIIQCFAAICPTMRCASEVRQKGRFVTICLRFITNIRHI